MNRLTPEALDALLAEHTKSKIPIRWEDDGVTEKAIAWECSHCEESVEWPCTLYLLASEVRDARPVIDEAYRERNELAAAMASVFPSSVGVDEQEPDWPVLYLQLPTGQVSYHFSPADMHLLNGISTVCEGWDGHTQEDRTKRLAALAHYEEGTK